MLIIENMKYLPKNKTRNITPTEKKNETNII